MNAAVLLLPVPEQYPCTKCGEMHTQTVNGLPYDLCPVCEADWLYEQGEAQ